MNSVKKAAASCMRVQLRLKVRNEQLGFLEVFVFCKAMGVKNHYRTGVGWM